MWDPFNQQVHWVGIGCWWICPLFGATLSEPYSIYNAQSMFVDGGLCSYIRIILDV